ncbi:hypothetical protein Tco_0673857 [Tanacetum coccineum]
MNQEEIRQVTARDEKWVPTKERVKIGTTNVRLEPNVPQKEKTFQVIIDVIKNFTCFKAFTISTEVPEIFMQQFWHTVKKVKGTNTYEFDLANKKCIVDVEVFHKILNICPRVQGEDFTEVLNNESTLTFLIDLGYEGPLYKYPSMFVDHMHQPWRTMAAIINKCLSGKTASNDRLRKSMIDILWGMQLKKGRREIMPYPRFTKIIINHVLSKHQSFAKLKNLQTHTIKDDGVVNRLKFVRISEDFQEYGLPIPKTMLTEKIKQSKSYQMFIKYSIGLIPPKKSRGKGSQGKKIADTRKETVKVSEESDSELARKRTSSRRVIKKKSQSLELAKSISLAEAAEEEAASIAFRDTSSVSKKMSLDPSHKLKGIQTLTPKEKLVVDTIQALKASKKSSRSQPHVGGSSERTGTKPRVPDESTVVFSPSGKGTGVTSPKFQQRSGIPLEVVLHNTQR